MVERITVFTSFMAELASSAPALVTGMMSSMYRMLWIFGNISFEVFAKLCCKLFDTVPSAFFEGSVSKSLRDLLLLINRKSKLCLDIYLTASVHARFLIIVHNHATATYPVERKRLLSSYCSYQIELRKGSRFQ